MLGFTSAETRRRNAFVENTIDEVAESLASEAVINRLGDMATVLADRVDMLYVPNFKDGLVSAPKKYQGTTGIPIIAMYPNEKIVADKTLAAMNPTQEQILRRKIKSWHGVSTDPSADINAINADLEARCPADISVGGDTGGFVWNSYTYQTLVNPLPNKAGKNLNRMIQGSSLVGLVPRENVPQELMNTNLVHELMHTRQFDYSPVISPDKLRKTMYSRELEAYHIGAYYGLAQSEIPSGKYHDSDGANHHWPIENLREEHARPGEPFYANPVLRAALDEAGIDILGW